MDWEGVSDQDLISMNFNTECHNIDTRSSVVDFGKYSKLLP
jgi:hypothetical protein